MIYFINPFNVFLNGNELTFFFVILSCFIIEYFIQKAKRGEEIYMRPIAAIKAMEEAVGRATEMGTPVLFVPGISGLDEIDTISGLTILGHVSAMTAEYEAKLQITPSSIQVLNDNYQFQATEVSINSIQEGNHDDTIISDNC